MEPGMDPSKKIKELQALEQNFQAVLHQKQSFQVHINEINNALSEVEKAEGEIYKTLSGVMIKVEKDKVIPELSEKRNEFETKISAIQKQESLLNKQIESLRDELTSGLSGSREA